MIGYFKNRDRVTLLNQSFWHAGRTLLPQRDKPINSSATVHEVYISVGRKALVREAASFPDVL